MLEFNPKVSVMIVTYNQEDLISETIESVLLQDYENIEIIVSDDASTDGTPEIIREYAEQYPEKIFPVFNEKNLGITGNSNAAFFACTGELVAVLGGDDLYLPNKISFQVELFRNADVVLSYHSVEIFLHQTGEVLFISNTTARENLNDAYEIISKGGIPGASSVMVRRSACPKYGFNPEFPVVSDWLFFIEVAMRGKVAKLDGVYGRYRKHGKGASENTFNLLSESLRTLEVIQYIYPEDNRLKVACKKGAYRYLLGELYRQLVKMNKVNSIYVAGLMFEKGFGVRRYASLLLRFFLKFDSLFKLISYSVVDMKGFIKRLSSS
ncbi:glycosyltransferase family 2 protein [Stutzerimonas nitrititolerans]|uniref:glycosyltransferase family 2 protein n=1 Tax=Stutzerimonas nitrititolerans TaxID=2482751 RepID=UPI002898B73D|nr:glycosyltransferase [Stutzerimonas nitrititolerans]